MENLREYIENAIESLKHPINTNKPLTDFEQGMIVGKYKTLVDCKTLLEQENIIKEI